MSNIIPMPIEREPRSVAEWRQALAEAEQRCSDARVRMNAKGEIIRRQSARSRFLEIERDAAVGEARVADTQRRLAESKLEAMEWSVPLVATGLGIVLGAIAMAAGMWAVMA